jgi:uncharacterized membrane protein
VRAAEQATGLQMAVYLGPVDGDARAAAEAQFVAGGLDQRPAVLVLVAPAAHRVEIVTAPGVRDRLPDDRCAEAVRVMVEHFRADRMADGLVAGIAELARAAGPGAPEPGAVELPDVIGDDLGDGGGGE